MVLYKLEDFDSDYSSSFDDNDIKGFDVYTDVNNENVGSVKNVLVDESGRFRYFVVDTGFWIFGKEVLLPVGRARIDQGARRVVASGLTKEQVEALPEFSDDLRIDYDYEERVRGVYRPQAVESTAPLDAPTTATAGAVAPRMDTTEYNRDTYDYQYDADLYDTNRQDQQSLKLYEERLVANKTRRKAGDVSIGKKVETETAQVSIPVEKEKVVVERTTPTDTRSVASPGTDAFREGEVARVELHEEAADVQKEAFVREEVKVKKVTEQETVNAQETIRKEELDLGKSGNLDVDNRR
jgi:uncharacterized protein (TIGR02271 family)